MTDVDSGWQKVNQEPRTDKKSPPAARRVVDAAAKAKMTCRIWETVVKSYQANIIVYGTVPRYFDLRPAKCNVVIVVKKKKKLI